MNAKPGPIIGRLLEELVEIDRCQSVVDLGCGQLRHLEMLLETFQRIMLVDTPRQLSRRLRFNEKTCTIKEYVSSLPVKLRRRIDIVDSDCFAASRFNADVVLTVNTMDVVPTKVRDNMCAAAIKNLRRRGLFGVIVPRNDTTITSRCSDENRFLDGHVFEHHGVMTFFRNFRDHQPLVSRIERLGTQVISDTSVYRHVCVLFQKQ